MKRRQEFLVEKRDGRREWLRATKLARSVHAALQAVNVDEPWRALDVAAAVLAGLRERRAGREQDDGAQPMLTTAELADAVQHVLIAAGFSEAAAAFHAVGAERRRRSVALALSSRAPLHEGLAPRSVRLQPLRRPQCD